MRLCTKMKRRTWLIYETHTKTTLSSLDVRMFCVCGVLFSLFFSLSKHFVTELEELLHVIDSLLSSLLLYLYPHSTTKHLTNDSLLSKWRYKHTQFLPKRETKTRMKYHFITQSIRENRQYICLLFHSLALRVFLPRNWLTVVYFVHDFRPFFHLF